MALKQNLSVKTEIMTNELPSIDKFLDEELDKLIKSTRLRLLLEKLALKEETTKDEAFKVIMVRLELKATKLKMIE